LQVPAEAIPREVEKRDARIRDLERRLRQCRLDDMKDSLDNILAQAEEINGIKVVAAHIENVSMDLLRRNADLLKEKTSRCVIALGSRTPQGKALLVVAVTQDLCAEGVSAVRLIKEIALPIKGSGGGRGDFAQAGGTEPGNLPASFERLKELMREKS
ncbi:MAG: DHHA1 domain-containing protein, partial [Candidatus Omnitrophica bacterium]|nr:DHHA1 domain-containing protein [Candidatus Omnitrophota bacterium]